MKYLTFFIILFVFWLVLTIDLSLANILVGLGAALITMIFFGRYFVKGVRKFYQPRRYYWLIVYMFIFLWECLKANIDVAYRVVHPRLPIKPGIVKVKLELTSPMAKSMLAASITMTPGTLTVDIIDDFIYIHWIYVSSTDPEVYSRKISGRFEKYIKRIFE
ncbi:MAG: Na+/H+ antiporter subunit E [Bacteroidales bacterium]|nr:MAG: Na+/H+ antiporter subunit E [Bacteroidales bacterium]